MGTSKCPLSQLSQLPLTRVLQLYLTTLFATTLVLSPKAFDEN